MRVVLPSILNDPHTENLLFSLIFVNMKDAIPQQRNAADTWTAKTVLDESKVLCIDEYAALCIMKRERRTPDPCGKYIVANNVVVKNDDLVEKRPPGGDRSQKGI
uniref:DDE_Tnp_1_7 domain-containing protein n=1 Tax=Ascaris lumbricoides TaxID=6252 RepID=A0A0M3I2K7_ASCLU